MKTQIFFSEDKMPTLTKEMIINDVIRKYPNTMKVFSKFKVDSCCGGGESIDTTAKVGGADVPELMIELNEEVDKSA